MSLHVLVFADEERITLPLRRDLVDEGFSVELVNDVQRGEARAVAGQFDAVVVGLQPVGGDGRPGARGYPPGFGVCATLRAAGMTSPILVVAGVDDEAIHARALRIGADDFLVVPIPGIVVAAHLRALARREHVGELIAGDLRLDLHARRCYRGSTEIRLARREYELIELLMRHQGTVWPKSHLFERLWGGVGSGPNLVEVYVRSLRRKIDVPFGRRAIETIRGGYRLVSDGG
jgi:DNA-binding response OmpR family regulator